jgi:hypothetical protein
VFPVRYELNVYILSRRNSVFKGSNVSFQISYIFHSDSLINSTWRAAETAPLNEQGEKGYISVLRFGRGGNCSCDDTVRLSEWPQVRRLAYQRLRAHTGWTYTPPAAEQRQV